MYMVRRTQVRGLNQRMCIRFQGFSPALEDVVTDPSGWHPVPGLCYSMVLSGESNQLRGKQIK
jgi:hypothetical protein